MNDATAVERPASDTTATLGGLFGDFL